MLMTVDAVNFGVDGEGDEGTAVMIENPLNVGVWAEGGDRIDSVFTVDACIAIEVAGDIYSCISCNDPVYVNVAVEGADAVIVDGTVVAGVALVTVIDVDGGV